MQFNLINNIFWQQMQLVHIIEIFANPNECAVSSELRGTI